MAYMLREVHLTAVAYIAVHIIYYLQEDLYKNCFRFD